jgi:hypothetical protein
MLSELAPVMTTTLSLIPSMIFINHPILAMLVLGLIALIGSVCIFALPIGWLPF